MGSSYIGVDDIQEEVPQLPFIRPQRMSNHASNMTLSPTYEGVLPLSSFGAGPRPVSRVGIHNMAMGDLINQRRESKMSSHSANGDGRGSLNGPHYTPRGDYEGNNTMGSRRGSNLVNNNLPQKGRRPPLYQGVPDPQASENGSTDGIFMQFPYGPSAPGGVDQPATDRVQYVKSANDEFDGGAVWPSTISRHGTAPGRNGGPYSTQNPMRLSMHDYQQLSPYHDGAVPHPGVGGVPHKGGGGAAGEDSFCINWKCIVALACLLFLLLCGLITLLAIRFTMMEPEAEAQVQNSGSLLPVSLNELPESSFWEISVPPKSSRILKYYSIESTLMTLNVKTHAERLVLYGLEGDIPAYTNFSFKHELSVVTKKIDSNQRLIYTDTFASSDMKTVYQYLSRGEWFMRLYNDDDGYKIVGLQPSFAKREPMCPQNCNAPKGVCNNLGYCQCSSQYTGLKCEKPALNCGLHGRRISAGNSQRCQCDEGWTGSQCEESATGCYPPDCNGNGTCSFGVCLCKPGVFGSACDETLCDNSCNSHGICIGGSCQCFDGFSGPSCQLKGCKGDAKCINGVCNGNAQCDCNRGFRGETCNQPACLDDCSNHGQCVQAGSPMQWECLCDPGFDGPNCGYKIEPTCTEICLTNPSCCESSGSCVPDAGARCQIAGKPENVQKSLFSSYTHVTSFLEKTQFLFEVQQNGKNVPFHFPKMNYSFVVRGQIVTPELRPFLGAQIFVEDHQRELGEAHTQFDGWFDFLVVTNQHQVSLVIEYNTEQFPNFGSDRVEMVITSVKDDFVIISEPIVIGKSRFRRDLQSCDHLLPEYSESIPQFVAQVEVSSTSSDGVLLLKNFFTESTVNESVPQMTYNSDNSHDSMRKISVYLGRYDAQRIRSVSVRLLIAGRLIPDSLDVTPGQALFWTHNWDKRDVYGNQVYGLAQAKLHIGLVGRGCDEPTWTNVIGTEVEGFSCHEEIAFSSHYCLTQSKSLYKGNGEVSHLSLYPPVKRSMTCLEGASVLESLPDGNVLIGNGEGVESFSWNDATGHCVLKSGYFKFSSIREAGDDEYFIAASPDLKYMYITRPEIPVVTRVEAGSKSPLATDIVGHSRFKCHDDPWRCVDSLNSPKGITVLPNGTLVFVDSSSLRSWTDSRLSTLWVSSTNPTIRHSCFDIPASQLYLSDLKTVKYNAFDDTFILFDYGKSVVKLNLRSRRASFIAIRARTSCQDPNNQVARVYYPFSTAVNSRGEVFVADSDPLNSRTTIYKISRDNKWSVYWSQDGMQILTWMTVTTNDTLLVVNMKSDGRSVIEVLGPMENPQESKIVDHANDRVIFFDDKGLHAKSESITDVDHKEESFEYNSNILDSVTVSSNYFNKTKVTRNLDKWEIQRSGSDLSWDLQNDVSLDTDGVICGVNGMRVSRSLGYLQGKVMTHLVVEDDSLFTKCLHSRWNGGLQTTCTDSSSVGFSTMMTSGSGDQTYQTEDNYPGFKLTAILPGASTHQVLEIEPASYVISYPGSEQVMVSRNDEILLKKQLTSEMVTYLKDSQKLSWFVLKEEKKQGMTLPTKATTSPGSKRVNHEIMFSEFGQLTLISAANRDLFAAGYDQDQLKTLEHAIFDRSDNGINVKTMVVDQESGVPEFHDEWSLTYQESSFVMTRDGGEKSHAISIRESKSSISNVYSIFKGSYDFETTWNPGTRELTKKLPDGGLCSYNFDDSGRLMSTKCRDQYSHEIKYLPASFVPKWAKSEDSEDKYHEFEFSKGNTKKFVFFKDREWVSLIHNSDSGAIDLKVRREWGQSESFERNYREFNLTSIGAVVEENGREELLPSVKVYSDGALEVHLDEKLSQTGFTELTAPAPSRKFFFKGVEIAATDINIDMDTRSYEQTVEIDENRKDFYPVTPYCGKVVQLSASEFLISGEDEPERSCVNKVTSDAEKGQIAKEFSSNGILSKVTRNNKVPVSFSLDANGFISQMESRKFQYNSAGQLVKVTEGSSKTLRLFYDHRGFLIRASLMQQPSDVHRLFFYLSDRFPDKISHVLIVSRDRDPQLVQIYYDHSGEVVKLHDGEFSYAVPTNPLGSPLQLIRLDPEDPANPQYNSEIKGFKLTFQSSIEIPEMKLAYINHRFLDLYSATYLDPNLEFVKHALSNPFETNMKTDINDYGHLRSTNSFSTVGDLSYYIPEVFSDPAFTELQRYIKELQQPRSRSNVVVSQFSQSFSSAVEAMLDSPIDPRLPKSPIGDPSLLLPSMTPGTLRWQGATPRLRR